MTKVISVTRKNGDVHEVTVDKDLVLSGNIYLQGKYFYVWDKELKKGVRLHRWIMGVTDESVIVDHIDRDESNNKRENLRICTVKQNNRNRKAKGYYLDRKSGKWCATIKVDGKRLYLGLYSTTHEAQEVYRKEHSKIFGEFSPYYKEESQ